MPSLEHPEGFWPTCVQEWVPSPQKSEFSNNEKKKHHKFTQATSLPNLRQI